MRPICTRCQRFFKPKQNGCAFIESMPTSSAAEPGAATPDLWAPYKLWNGDLWECPGCGANIIVGVAQRPVAEHYEERFDDEVERYAPEVRVNDC